MGLFSRIFGKDKKEAVENDKELSAGELNAYVSIGGYGFKLAEASKLLMSVSNPTEARKILRETGEILENKEFSRLCELAANTMSDDQLIPICRQLSRTFGSQAIMLLNHSREGLEKT